MISRELEKFGIGWSRRLGERCWRAQEEEGRSKVKNRTLRCEGCGTQDRLRICRLWHPPGIRIEESWSRFRPYRWLAERSVHKGRRKLIHRESFRASVLDLSEAQAVLASIAEKRCLLTTPSLLSRATQILLNPLRGGHPPRLALNRSCQPIFYLWVIVEWECFRCV